MTQDTAHQDRLRPEARPVTFGDLDVRQRAGFERVVKLMQAAADALPDAAQQPDREPGPYLEFGRTATTALVGGERGTGKTTLLLTLFRELNPASDPREERDEPVPGLRLLTPGTDFHDAMNDLVLLQNTVVLAFSPNTPDRARRLDPDTYAVEARRAERDRLGVNVRFSAVLARLSAAVAAHSQRTRPLFVLPVDDLDLNPSACVRLLQLLRAVHSPHLFVLLAADQRLVETVLRLS